MKTNIAQLRKACAEEGFALEPTGGIDKENFETIVRMRLKQT